GYAPSNSDRREGILRTKRLEYLDCVAQFFDPSTMIFFFKNKHIMIDLGTDNNNKINWDLKDKQDFIDIIEIVYRGGKERSWSGNYSERLLDK
ncbi:hypothetical protein Gotri_006958, partial [Gossypium trilobum]|nr:hypothetical protein [Gossypium trilobum]